MPSPTTLAVPFSAWLFLAVVLAFGLVIDLVAHRGSHAQSRKADLLWSAIWIALALLFGVWVHIQFGSAIATDYLTAYLVEKSLSLDNLFVFLIVFSRLGIPKAEQHRVLQWGIIGAFVTRGIFIAAGAALLSAWHGIVYVLGAFLIYTGIQTVRETVSEARGAKKNAAEDENPVMRFVRRHLPFGTRLDGHKFFTIENGRRIGTPLLLALIVIEITDVIFALDSIPAVFAISEEPFIVYSSNVFAILGLRALYLVLADLLRDLQYLRYGLGAILLFAGAKMLASKFIHVPHLVSLGVVVAVLAASVIPSVIAKRRRERRSAPPSALSRSAQP
jgi:tellurite resistance protein TerC